MTGARVEKMGGFGIAIIFPYKAIPDRKTYWALKKWDFKKMPGTNHWLTEDTPEGKTLAENIAELYNTRYS